MNEEMYEQAKARMQDAFRQTQTQTAKAAERFGGLLLTGAKKLKEAADAAGEAIRTDLNSRP